MYIKYAEIDVEWIQRSHQMLIRSYYICCINILNSEISWNLFLIFMNIEWAEITIANVCSYLGSMSFDGTLQW